MANMTFKADLLPNSDYGYRLGSITTNPPKRWIIPGQRTVCMSPSAWSVLRARPFPPAKAT